MQEDNYDTITNEIFEEHPTIKICFNITSKLHNTSFDYCYYIAVICSWNFQILSNIRGKVKSDYNFLKGLLCYCRER